MSAVFPFLNLQRKQCHLMLLALVELLLAVLAQSEARVAVIRTGSTLQQQRHDTVMSWRPACAACSTLVSHCLSVSRYLKMLRPRGRTVTFMAMPVLCTCLQEACPAPARSVPLSTHVRGNSAGWGLLYVST